MSRAGVFGGLWAGDAMQATSLSARSGVSERYPIFTPESIEEDRRSSPTIRDYLMISMFKMFKLTFVSHESLVGSSKFWLMINSLLCYIIIYFNPFENLKQGDSSLSHSERWGLSPEMHRRMAAKVHGLPHLQGATILKSFEVRNPRRKNVRSSHWVIAKESVPANVEQANVDRAMRNYW